MGESAQLSFAPKISGEFLSIWAKFPQISKFFGWTMDEIRPNRQKFARNFWGRTSTARIRPVRPKKIYCVYFLVLGFRNQKKYQNCVKFVLRLNLLKKTQGFYLFKADFIWRVPLGSKISKFWIFFLILEPQYRQCSYQYAVRFFLRWNYLHKTFISPFWAEICMGDP
jgi:hypothetical protein